MLIRGCHMLSYVPAILFLVGCSSSVTKVLSNKKVIEAGLEPELVCSETIKLNYGKADSSHSLQFKYLGYGGYYMSNGSSSLLIDPFFSPYRMVGLNIRKIGTKPENVEAGILDKKEELYNNCRAIFVSHSHYDHLMDVPYVFNNFLDTSKARVYGSASTKRLIKSVIDSTSIQVIENYVCSDTTIGEWIYLADLSIRVLPLRTEHAPHYNAIFPINLYDGETEPVNKYTNDLAKMSVRKWRKGSVYGYVVDFLEKGNPVFRVYLLTSSSNIPNGMVHAQVLDEHPVDLAILGSASFDNVDNYPEGILQHIRPGKVLMAHWEDLFKPYLKNPPRFIRTNNFKNLLIRINEAYPWKDGTVQNVYFPYPGVDIEIYF